MIDRTTARGLFLGAIALAFGGASMRHQVGSFAHAGPGLFPLMVSGLLLLIAVATLLQAWRRRGEPLQFQWRNISLLLGALCSMALVSHFLNMTAGIVVMVCIASFAASSLSWRRNAWVCVGLVAIAFAFQKLLGLNLPLL